MKTSEQFLAAKDDAAVQKIAVIYVPGAIKLDDFKIVVVDCQQFFPAAQHFFTLPVMSLDKTTKKFTAEQLKLRQSYGNYFAGLHGQVIDVASPYALARVLRLEEEEKKDEKKVKHSKNVVLAKLGAIAGCIEPPTGTETSVALAYGSFNCCGVNYFCQYALDRMNRQFSGLDINNSLLSNDGSDGLNSGFYQCCQLQPKTSARLHFEMQPHFLEKS